MYFPFVSIIIPVKNEAQNIISCLDGIKNQDYPSDRFEVIIVDNGSTDGTMELINEYKKRKLIKNLSIFQKHDGTIGAVRNYGAQKAKGEILAFLDGDSVPHKNWISLGIKILIIKPEVACVGFTFQNPEKETSWIVRTWYKIGRGSKYIKSGYVEWLSSFNLIIWKKIFEELGGFNEILETCEDAELGYRISKHYKLWFSNEITVRHLGEAKTLKQFFLKELWRGKGNLLSFFYSKNKWKDFPSVFIPIFYVFTHFISILFSIYLYFFKHDILTTFCIVGYTVIISLPVALTIRKFKKISSILDFIHILTLYYVYLIARGIGPFYRLIKK